MTDKMKDPLQLLALEARNFKALHVFAVEFPPDGGAVVVGGPNRAGKTSAAVDSLRALLLGDRYKPTNPTRDGSAVAAHVAALFGDGTKVERGGKNFSLKVTAPGDPDARQGLLDARFARLAIDPSPLLIGSGKDRVEALLKSLPGVGEKLDGLDRQHTDLFSQRTSAGTLANSAETQLAAMPHYPDAPAEVVSVSALAEEIRAAEANNSKRDMVEAEFGRARDFTMALSMQVDELQRKLTHAQVSRDTLEATLDTLSAIDTGPTRAKLETAEEDNAKVRANAARKAQEADAIAKRAEHKRLDNGISFVRDARQALLEGADMPLAGLGIKDGELTFNGQSWDGIAGSDRLNIVIQICRKQQPGCRFVVVGPCEEMDIDTLRRFSDACKAVGLLAVCTRVSMGPEVDHVIENGRIVGAEDA